MKPGGLSHPDAPIMFNFYERGLGQIRRYERFYEENNFQYIVLYPTLWFFIDYDYKLSHVTKNIPFKALYSQQFWYHILILQKLVTFFFSNNNVW